MNGRAPKRGHWCPLFQSLVVNDRAQLSIKDGTGPAQANGVPKAGGCLLGGLAAGSMPSPGNRMQSQDEDQILLMGQLGNLRVPVLGLLRR